MGANPDRLYWTGYYQEGGLIINQLKDAWYKGRIMVADCSVDPSLVKIAGAANAEGVFATMTQMPAIGRAPIAGPRMLMLDEPSMGLAPLIVAQVMVVSREVTSRGYVIENGATTMTGTGAELMADSGIVAAYLGS